VGGEKLLVDWLFLWRHSFCASLVWREMEFVSQLQMEIGDCFLSSALNARQRIREAALVIR